MIPCTGHSSLDGLQRRAATLSAHRILAMNRGSSTSLYFGDFSHPDLPPTTILSKTGTRQGCPLEPQLFALGLHPLLCSLARLMGREGSVISYSDDLHLVGPPTTVALALKTLLQPSPPLEASISISLYCRLSAIGLSLSPGKSSVLLGNNVTPSSTIEDNFGPELLAPHLVRQFLSSLSRGM